MQNQTFPINLSKKTLSQTSRGVSISILKSEISFASLVNQGRAANLRLRKPLLKMGFVLLIFLQVGVCSTQK